MTTKQLAVPVVAAVVGGALTAAVMVAGGGTSSRSSIVQGGLLTPGGEQRLTASEIYERAAPGVVYVHARTVQPGATTAFQAETGGEFAVSTGSGFVLDEDGRVVTNAHVVTGVTEVQITFPDGGTRPAQVLGKDEETDLALLAVDPSGLDLRPLELGDSDAVRPGDQVVAIGIPGGLQATAGTGRVAATGRRVEAPAGYVVDGVLETDAVIEPATSGGPVMGPDGRVVGISTRLSPDGGDAGYAVPANTAREVLAVLQEGQRVIRPYLGLSGEAVAGGVEVREVRVPGPADRAGLHTGDVIEAIDGRPVHTLGGLLADVERRRPGEAVTLRVLRDGSRGDIAVRLEERPATLAAG